MRGNAGCSCGFILLHGTSGVEPRWEQRLKTPYYCILRQFWSFLAAASPLLFNSKTDTYTWSHQTFQVTCDLALGCLRFHVRSVTYSPDDLHTSRWQFEEGWACCVLSSSPGYNQMASFGQRSVLQLKPSILTDIDSVKWRRHFSK